jgi:hypothetical protein
MGRSDDEDTEDELEQLEGSEHEMDGEADASEKSLEKEQPQPHHQLGERA